MTNRVGYMASTQSASPPRALNVAMISERVMCGIAMVRGLTNLVMRQRELRLAQYHVFNRL
ncbi:MAG: hypothetical protein IPN81_10910 [Nitrosomonadales bacterium]|nr:hypothetical protein [Nitrosomonadales bacterium]